MALHDRGTIRQGCLHHYTDSIIHDGGATDINPDAQQRCLYKYTDFMIHDGSGVTYTNTTMHDRSVHSYTYTIVHQYRDIKMFVVLILLAASYKKKKRFSTDEIQCNINQHC